MIKKLITRLFGLDRPHGDELLAGYREECRANLAAENAEFWAERERKKAMHREALRRIPHDLPMDEIRARMKQAGSNQAMPRRVSRNDPPPISSGQRIASIT